VRRLGVQGSSRVRLLTGRRHGWATPVGHQARRATGAVRPTRTSSASDPSSTPVRTGAFQASGGGSSPPGAAMPPSDTWDSPPAPQAGRAGSSPAGGTRSSGLLLGCRLPWILTIRCGLTASQRPVKASTWRFESSRRSAMTAGSMPALPTMACWPSSKVLACKASQPGATPGRASMWRSFSGQDVGLPIRGRGFDSLSPHQSTSQSMRWSVNGRPTVFQTVHGSSILPHRTTATARRRRARLPGVPCDDALPGRHRTVAPMVRKLTRSSSRLKPGGRRFDSVPDHSMAGSPMAERRSYKTRVDGSIPSRPTHEPVR
jgi:hypothetical protein